MAEEVKFYFGLWLMAILAASTNIMSM